MMNRYWELPVAYHVFLALFLLASLLELYFAFREQEGPRKVVKTFCLLFLAAAVIALVPNEPLLYFGLLLGALGDFFLIFKKSSRLFVLGTIAFFADHACLIAEYILLTQRGGPAYLAFTFAFLPLFTLAFMVAGWKLTGSKLMGTFGTVYFAILALDFLWAVIASAVAGRFFYLAAIGGAFFILSDVILSITRYKKTVKRREFYVMLTYLLAQACVGLGVALSVAL